MENEATILDYARNDLWSIVLLDDNSVEVTRYPSARTVIKQSFSTAFGAKLFFDYQVEEKGIGNGM